MKKKLLILVFIIFITQIASANANFDVKRMKEMHNSNFKLTNIKNTDKNIELKEDNKTSKEKSEETATKENDKKKTEIKPQGPLTNYQYDDINYKYNRLNKYIQSNIEYSKSGQKIRFN